MSRKYVLISDSKKVYQFFEKYKLDFTSTLDSLIDVLENIISKINSDNVSDEMMKLLMNKVDNLSSMHEDINTKISSDLNKLKEEQLKAITEQSKISMLELIEKSLKEQEKISKEIVPQSIYNKIDDFAMNINRNIQDLKQSDGDNKLCQLINIKISELKQDCENSIKTAIDQQNTKAYDNIIHRIETGALQMLAEVIPKGTLEISEKIITLSNQLASLTNKDDIEKKYFEFLTIFQKDIIEKLIDTDIKVTNAISVNSVQTRLYDQMNEFLDRYKQNSSIRGKIEENIIEETLNNMFSHAEIINNSKQSSSCDFKIKRTGRPDILIEVKSYTRNVPKEELDKFLNDINLNNCYGIMISLHSGISNKDDYEIGIVNKNFVVYIHNVGKDMNKIKGAIDILDHLHGKLKVISGDIYNMTSDELRRISEAYHNFLREKKNILLSIKEFSQKMTASISNLTNIPLEEYLQSKMNFARVDGFLCSICKIKVCKNNRALKTHEISCSKKKKNIEDSVEDSGDLDE